jgi:hypothetical protein
MKDPVTIHIFNNTARTIAGLRSLSQIGNNPNNRVIVTGNIVCRLQENTGSWCLPPSPVLVEATREIHRCYRRGASLAGFDQVEATARADGTRRWMLPIVCRPAGKLNAGPLHCYRSVLRRWPFRR